MLNTIYGSQVTIYKFVRSVSCKSHYASSSDILKSESIEFTGMDVLNKSIFICSLIYKFPLIFF